MRHRTWLWLAGATSFLLACSRPAPAPASDTVTSSVSSPTPLTQETAVAAAISPLPPEYQAGASVIATDSTGKTRVVKQGDGDMMCLEPDTAAKDFHAACYHRSLDPFMARGRELRAAGVKGAEVDSVRFREIQGGTLQMPKEPAALYQYFGGHYDPGTGKVVGAQSLYVVYIPFATGKSTGLSEKPSKSGPWIMFPGTPKAHIMFTGSMSPP